MRTKTRKISSIISLFLVIALIFGNSGFVSFASSIDLNRDKITDEENILSEGGLISNQESENNDNQTSNVTEPTIDEETTAQTSGEDPEEEIVEESNAEVEGTESQVQETELAETESQAQVEVLNGATTFDGGTMSITTNKDADSWEYYNDPATITVSVDIIKDADMPAGQRRTVDIKLNSTNAYKVDDYPRTSMGIISASKLGSDMVRYVLDNDFIPTKGMRITIGYALNGSYTTYFGINSPAGVLSEKLLDNPQYEIVATATDTANNEKVSETVNLKKDYPEEFLISGETVDGTTNTPVSTGLDEYKVASNGIVYMGSSPANATQAPAFLFKFSDAMHTPLRNFSVNYPLPENVIISNYAPIFVNQEKSGSSMYLQGSSAIRTFKDGTVQTAPNILSTSIDPYTFAGIQPASYAPWLGFYMASNTNVSLGKIALATPGVHEASEPINISYDQLVSDGAGGYKVEHVVKEFDTIKVTVPEFENIPTYKGIALEKEVSSDDEGRVNYGSLINRLTAKQIADDQIFNHHPNGEITLQVPEELDLSTLQFRDTVYKYFDSIQYTIRLADSSTVQREITDVKLSNPFEKADDEKITKVVIKLGQDGIPDSISSFIGIIGKFSKPASGDKIKMPIAISSVQGTENLEYEWTYTSAPDNLNIKISPIPIIFLDEATEFFESKGLSGELSSSSQSSKEYNDLKIDVLSDDPLSLKLLSGHINAGVEGIQAQKLQISGRQYVEYTTNLHPETREAEIVGVAQLDLNLSDDEYYTSLTFHIEKIKLSNNAHLVKYFSVLYRNKQSFVGESGQTEKVVHNKGYAYTVSYSSPDIEDATNTRDSNMQQPFATYADMEFVAKAGTGAMLAIGPTSTARGQFVNKVVELQTNSMVKLTEVQNLAVPATYSEGTFIYYRIDPNFKYYGSDPLIHVEKLNGDDWIAYNVSGLPINTLTTYKIAANSFFCLPATQDNVEYEILSEGYLDLGPTLLSDKELSPFHGFSIGASFSPIVIKDTMGLTTSSGVTYEEPRLVPGTGSKTMVVTSNLDGITIIPGKNDRYYVNGVSYTANEYNTLTADVVLGNVKKIYKDYSLKFDLPRKGELHTTSTGLSMKNEYDLRLRSAVTLPEGYTGYVKYYDETGAVLNESDYGKATTIEVFIDYIPESRTAIVQLPLTVITEDEVYNIADKAVAGIYAHSTFIEMTAGSTAEISGEAESNGFGKYTFNYYQVRGKYFTESSAEDPDGLFTQGVDLNTIAGYQNIKFKDLEDQTVYTPTSPDNGNSYILRLPPKKTTYKLAPDLEEVLESYNYVITKHTPDEPENINSNFPRNFLLDGVKFNLNTSGMATVEYATDFNYINLGIYENPGITYSPNPIRVKVGDTLTVTVSTLKAELSNYLPDDGATFANTTVDTNASTIIFKGVSETLDGNNNPIFKNGKVELINYFGDKYTTDLLYNVYDDDKVTFDVNGGTWIHATDTIQVLLNSSKNVASADVPSVTAPTGYSFTGWLLVRTNTQVDPVTQTLQKNDVLKAIYTANAPTPYALKEVENLTSTDGKTVVGDTLQYKVTVKNNGVNSTWSNVTLEDILPEGVNFTGTVKVDGTTLNPGEFTYNETSRTLTVGLGNLFGGQAGGASQDVKVVTFTVTVDESAYGKEIKNVATVTGDEGEGEEVTDPGKEVGSKDPIPSAVKTVANLTSTDGKTVVGDTLEYTITVMNNQKNSVWKNVVITDVLPTGVNYVGPIKIGGTTATASEAQYDTNSKTITVNLGDIQGGKEDGTGKDTKVVTFTVTVNESAYGQEIKNTANVTGDGGEGGETTDPGIDVVSKEPIPAITKTVENTSSTLGKTVVGDTLKYTVTVQNNQKHSTWKDVVVTDVLPTGVNYVGPVSINGTEATASEATYDARSGTLTVTLGDLNGGKDDGSGKDTKVITFTVTVNESAYQTTVTNTAVAKGDGKEVVGTDPGVNVTSKDIDPSAVKKVENLTSSDGKTYVGDLLKYTITATNNQANSIWKDVVVTDVLPTGVTYVGPVSINGTEATVAETTYDIGSKTLIVNLGDIQGGNTDGTGKDTKIITFTVTVNESAYNTEIKNTANVVGEDGDGGETTDPGIDVVSKEPIPVANKKVDNLTNTEGKNFVGDILKYTITVSNNQVHSTWKDVVVTDVLPTGVTYVGPVSINGTEATAAEATYDIGSKTLTVNLGDIQGGKTDGTGKDTKIITFTVTVNESAYDTEIKNTANVVGEGGEGGETTDPGIDVVSKEPIPAITKAVENTSSTLGKTVVGDTLKYTVTVQNNQKHSTWKDVVVTDVLPTGVNYVGPVSINGTEATTEATYDAGSGTLTVTLGELNGGKEDGSGKDTKIITFTVTVNDSALQTTITNTAIAKGDGKEVVGTDPGVNVTSKHVNPSAVKKVENLTSTDGKTYVGDLLKYTITATNNQANSIWKDVVVTDVLPTGVTYVGPVSINGTEATAAEATYDIGSKTLIVNLGDIQGGNTDGSGKDTKIITFTVTVNESAYDTEIKNTANVVGEDGEGGETTDPGIDVVSKEPIPVANKKVDNLTNTEGKTFVGDILKYTITVSNNQIHSTWKDVVVTDVLPTGVTYAGPVSINGTEATATEATYDIGSGTLTVNLGDIQGGKEDGSGKDTKIITFTVTVNESAYGSEIKNTANVVGEDGDGGETTDPGIDVVSKEPIPAITKGVENTSSTLGKTVVGDTLKYTVTVQNNQKHSTWKGVVVTDVLPTGVNYVGPVSINGTEATPSETTYDAGSGTLTVTLGDLNGGNDDGTGKDTKIITFTVAVNESAYQTTVTNTAVAKGDGKEVVGTDPGVNVTSKDIDPSAVKKVENLTSTDGKTYVGDLLKYTITATNNQANSVWKDVVVTDVLPTGVTYVGPVSINGTEATAAEATYDIGSKTLIVNLGDIQGGNADGSGKDTKIITFTVTVNESAYDTEIKNTANVVGEDGEGGETTDPGIDVVSKEPIPALTKGVENTSSTSGKTVVGDTLKYTITASNNQVHSTWKDVVVTDVLPTGVTYVGPVSINGTEATATEATYDIGSKTLTVNLGNIQGGNDDGSGKDTKVITFTVTVNESAYQTTVTNTAVAKGDGKEVVGTDPGVNVTSKDIDPSAVKKVENLTSADGKTYVGDTLRYTITATNNQTNSVWKDVVVTDVLPTGVTYVGPVSINGTEATAAEATYDTGSKTLTVNLGDIQGGKDDGSGKDTKIITFTVTVNESAYDTEIKNTANVVGEDGEGGETTDPGIDVVSKKPIPVANKKVDNLTNTEGKTVVGDTLKYTITASNNQVHSTWKNVIVTDVLPTGVTYVGPVSINGTEATATEATYDAGSKTLIVNLGNIQGGNTDGTGKDTKLITFTVTVNESAYDTEIKNTANVVGEGGEGGETTDPGIDVVSKEPSPAATKAVKNVSNTTGKTVVGDTLEYAITVSNEQVHSVWKQVVVTDELPTGVDYVGPIFINGTQATSNAASYDASTKTIIVNLGDIQGGDIDGTGKDIEVITFKVTVNESAYDTEIVNVAHVEGEDGDGDTDVPDEGIDVVSKEPIPNAVKKSENTTNNTGKTVVGDTLKYTITVSNDQKHSVWKNVIITDILPIGVDYVGPVYIDGAKTQAASYDKATSTLTVSLGDLQGGSDNGNGKDVKVVTFDTVVNGSAYMSSITNTATVEGDEATVSITDKVVDVTSKEVLPVGSKEVANLSGNSDRTLPEDVLEYTITVTNEQPYSVWKGVVVKDILPEGVTFLDKVFVNQNQLTGSQYTYNKGTRELLVPLGDMEGGNESGVGRDLKVITFTVSVNKDAAGQIVTNTADIVGEDLDGNTPSTTVTDGGIEVLDLEPTATITNEVKNLSRDEKYAKINDRLQYTVKVENTKQNSIWEDVVLTDVLPEGVEFKGDVTLNGALLASSDYKYEVTTRTLTINLGDLDARVLRQRSLNTIVRDGRAMSEQERVSEMVLTFGGSVSSKAPEEILLKTNATASNGILAVSAQDQGIMITHSDWPTTTTPDPDKTEKGKIKWKATRSTKSGNNGKAVPKTSDDNSTVAYSIGLASSMMLLLYLVKKKKEESEEKINSN